MEIMVAVIIIGILAAMAMPQYQKTVELNYKREAQDLLLTIYYGERAYFLSHNTYTPWLNSDPLYRSLSHRSGCRGAVYGSGPAHRRRTMRRPEYSDRSDPRLKRKLVHLSRRDEYVLMSIGQAGKHELRAKKDQGEGLPGFTLLEVLVSSALIVVLAGGMLLSFVAAIKVSAGASSNVEASGLAQQTLEKFRNKIGCDMGAGPSGEWFDDSCNPSFLPSANTSDPLPAGALYPGSTRTYTVTPENCGGGIGSCFKVTAKVSWTPPP